MHSLFTTKHNIEQSIDSWVF